jgi:bifunctional non-homologous end joining protein LigD
MAQLSKNGAVWHSKSHNPTSSLRAKISSAISKPKPKPQPPQFIEPMKARLAGSPPSDDGWIYEIKFDGFRALAFIKDHEIHLLSRNEKDLTGKFPEIARSFAALMADEAVIDGEIVALDKKGVSSFQLLQAFESGEKRPPIFFYAFDLLHLNGKDLKKRPLIERKAVLEKLLEIKSPLIRYSASLGEDAEKLLKHAKKLGLEGLIGKRKTSAYEPGRRSGAWIKLKLHREQEFVIGGYTDPEGGRRHFGALLIGFYEKGKLKFCGKVGTGFDARLLATLHAQFQKMARADCPFVNLPETRGGRYNPRITAAEMKRCHWLRPRLVCQVKFHEWTRDAKLRQPVFLGLRQDKRAAEVAREQAG